MNKMWSTHPSVDGAHSVAVHFEVFHAVLLDELRHVHQVGHVFAGIGHLDITETLCRNRREFAFALIGQLSTPGGAHPPEIQQVLNLTLRQLCSFLQQRRHKAAVMVGRLMSLSTVQPAPVQCDPHAEKPCIHVLVLGSS